MTRVLLVCLLAAMLGEVNAGNAADKTADDDGSFDLRRAICFVVYPVISNAAFAAKALLKDTNSPVLREGLMAANSALKRALQAELRPAVDRANPSAQFYYAQGLLTVAKCDEALGTVSSANRAESKRLFQAAAKQGHPGAAEKLAQIADDPAEVRRWRLTAAERGCLTSFRIIAWQGDYEEICSKYGSPSPTDYFTNLDQAYYFACLHLMVECHWKDLFDTKSIPFFTHGQLLSYLISYSPSEHRITALGNFKRLEERAGITFSEMRSDYLLGEVDVGEWRK